MYVASIRTDIDSLIVVDVIDAYQYREHRCENHGIQQPNVPQQELHRNAFVIGNLETKN